MQSSHTSNKIFNSKIWIFSFVTYSSTMRKPLKQESPRPVPLAYSRRAAQGLIDSCPRTVLAPARKTFPFDWRNSTTSDWTRLFRLFNKNNKIQKKIIYFYFSFFLTFIQIEKRLFSLLHYSAVVSFLWDCMRLIANYSCHHLFFGAFWVPASFHFFDCLFEIKIEILTKQHADREAQNFKT